MKQESNSGNAILNEGLNFAMEFGANWLQPIQARLSEKFPKLTGSELDKFDFVCRDAMHYGFKIVYDRLNILCDKKETIQSGQLTTEFNSTMLQNYPWISEPNLGRLLNQSLYYTWKDGLNSCIV